MRYMDLFSGIGGFALGLRQAGIYDGARIRKLTPLECERLQGFPDGWTEYGADGRKMSDNARYKALGNAVTVNFPRMIGEKIKPVDKIKKYSNN